LTTRPYPATEGGLADIVQHRSLREIPSICETAEILKPLNVHGYAIICKKRIMYGKHDIDLAKQLLSSFWEYWVAPNSGKFGGSLARGCRKYGGYWPVSARSVVPSTDAF
jgi:hypothetical protein